MRNWLAASLAGCLLVLPACDAENVQWAFVSNPGGSFGPTGGAVLVIRVSSSSGLALAGEFLRVEGVDERGPVSVLLPHQGDFGVLVRDGEVEVRSPALSFDEAGGTRPGRIQVPGGMVHVPPAGGPASLLVQLPDCSVVHPGGVGPGTLYVARSGTLMILQSGAGLVVFGEREQPEVVGLSASLTTTPAGNRYALLLPGNQLRLLDTPPLPTPEQRVVPVSAHDSLRILGPRSEVLAELPASAVSLQNSTPGVFLQASLPQGLPGDPQPMSLLMATANRYLLRINQ